MAAAEYYGGPPQGQPQPQRPPPQMQQPQQAPRPNSSQMNLQPNLPYPISDAPPPYSGYAENQRPQSQPPPGQRIPQPNGQPPYNPGPYIPYSPNGPPNANTHQYPPEKTPQRPSTLQNMYRPSDYTSSHPPPPQMQQQQPPPGGYFQPVAPGLGAMSQVYGNQERPPRRSSITGYPPESDPYRRSSSRSPSRSRRHHTKPRPDAPRKKGSGVNTFLGAGGGAIIGDLIFPGLGTLGGALLGGVGGHEYSKKRTQSNPSKGYRRSYSGSGNYDDDYRRGRR